MFKRIVKWTVVIAVMATTVTIVVVIQRLPSRPAEAPTSLLTIEQIQSLWSLVTARVQVADVILIEQQGLTGGLQVAAAVKGDYLIEIDLAQARLNQVDPQRRHAVLVLPPPAATACRVDLERSRLFGLGSYGLWQITPGDAGYTAVTNKAYREAQATIAAAASNPQALSQARHHAELVLTTFLRALGWEVSVRWLDHPSTSPSEPQTERNLDMTKPESTAVVDDTLVALRSRLADSIGYLAARRWLAGGAGETQTAPPAAPSSDVQGISATNTAAADTPPDERSS